MAKKQIAEPIEEFEGLIDNDQAALLFGMDPVSFKNWRNRRDPKNPHPPFVPISEGRIRYRISELEAFIQARRVDQAVQLSGS